MNVLVIGSGGREHTLAWKISQSPHLTKLYIAPGNGGTWEVGENINVKDTDFGGIKEIVIDKQIDMVVVGPEEPLVKGIGDFFKEDPELREVPVIGSGRMGARLEGSKEFAHRFMEKYRIPTPGYKSFSEGQYEEAVNYLDGLTPPYVLKADGLAAGKGVVISETLREARDTLKEFFGGKFGEASKKVVVEDYLEGRELSVFVLTDGENYKMFPLAKDYKRAGEKDTGSNTGGMGSLSPVTYVDESFIEKIEEKIVKPTIGGLRQEGIPYKGFLYFGLMKIEDEPYVLEYNIRMGDPEAQVVIPRMKSDLLEAFIALSNNKLHDYTLEIDDSVAAAVILASEGYPGEYEKGKEISISVPLEQVHLFHAGTAYDNGRLVTSGGRVMAVASVALTFEKALAFIYEQIGQIDFEGKYFRKDIGYDI
ncbi:MAG: phosphoribosylamine--glycine ligase [Bacteroidales bacterium]|nr:phosphoribosylamine--glycine ligase [Bacteroidales bacterium]